MLSRVYSCAVVGLEGVIVEVEVDYTNGLPAVIIVGLPDADDVVQRFTGRDGESGLIDDLVAGV